MNYMSAIMSQNGRKMAKIMHNAAKKFDWDRTRKKEGTDKGKLQRSSILKVMMQHLIFVVRCRTTCGIEGEK